MCVFAMCERGADEMANSVHRRVGYGGQGGASGASGAVGGFDEHTVHRHFHGDAEARNQPGSFVTPHCP